MTSPRKNGGAPTEHRLGAPAVGLAAAAFVVPMLTVLTGFVAQLIGSADLAVGAFFFMTPIAGVVGAALGVTAVVFAFVIRSRTGGADRRWIPALVLGLLGTLVIPVYLLILTL